MLKKLFRYCFFSIVLLAVACAPKVAPPPEYIEEEFSLEEILHKAGGDVEVLKAITDIHIEKDNSPYDFVNASVLAKKPGWVHMRIYKFGMLIRDFVIRDGDLHVLSGKKSENLKKLGDEFYNAVFWWDGIEEGMMQREGEEYVIQAVDRKIRIDRGTLIPVHQELTAFDRKIDIQYSEPRKDDHGSWYPSRITINAGNFTFKVNVKKLLKNPQLGKMDFRPQS